MKTNRVKEFFSGPALDQSMQLSLQERVYFGPFITIADSKTYRDGDYFMLFQRDLGASIVVGTSSTTGGGGANSVGYSQLFDALPSSFPSLLIGIDFSTSLTRFFRIGM